MKSAFQPQVGNPDRVVRSLIKVPMSRCPRTGRTVIAADINNPCESFGNGVGIPATLPLTGTGITPDNHSTERFRSAVGLLCD